MSADHDTRCGESYAPRAEVLPSEHSDAGAATFASGDGSLPADCAEVFTRADELYGSLKLAPPAHGTSHGSKDHQDQAENHENNPDAPQNGNLRDESDYQQDDAEDDDLLLLASWPSFDGMSATA